MKNKKYIVLWGATGFHNMGDEAMLAGNIEVLMKSKYKIVVLSNYPEVTSQLHDVTTKPDFNRLIEEEISKYHNKLIKGWLFLLVCFKLGWNAKRVQKNKAIKFLSFLEKEFLTTLANCEALLIVGGGNLNDIFGWRGLIARTITVSLVKILGKPVFLGGQTVGPLNKWWSRMLAKKFLEKVDLLTLRENFSKNVIEKIGVRSDRVKIVPDDAFDITPINKEEALRLLFEEGMDIKKIKKEGKKIIAITPRAWWKMDDRNRPLKEALEGIIRFLVKRNKNYIIFVPTSFYQGSRDDDAKTSLELLSRIGISGDTDFKILSGKYNWNQLKGIFGLTDATIGTSYHSVVFAISMGVPTLGLYVDEYYRLKIGGLFDLVGFKDLAINIKNLSRAELINRLNRFLEQKEVLREGLMKRINEIKNRSCHASKRLIKILEKRKCI